MEAICCTQDLRLELQQSYFEDALNNAHTVKQKWHAIKKYWPYMSKCSKITKINDESDSQQIANISNNFVAETGNTLALQIPHRNENPSPMNNMPPVFEFRELPLIDMVAVVREFKS